MTQYSALVAELNVRLLPKSLITKILRAKLFDD